MSEPNPIDTAATVERLVRATGEAIPDHLHEAELLERCAAAGVEPVEQGGE